MPRLALLLVLSLAACGPAEPEDGGVETAPAVVLDTDDGPVSLSDFVGRPVVVQFAPADDAGAWAALADALADLEASGAVVIAIETDAGSDAAAEAFGFDGTALAVILDGEGTVRGRAAPTSGDALFALAGPVLAEADLAETVEWPGADSLDALVEAGGLVVDMGATAGAYPYALRLSLDHLAADALPADLGTPLAFAGADAEAAAALAASWGYVSVFVADADGALTAVAPERPDLPRPPGRSGGVRG